MFHNKLNNRADLFLGQSIVVVYDCIGLKVRFAAEKPIFRMWIRPLVFFATYNFKIRVFMC